MIVEKIEIFDEVSRDGQAISAFLFYNTKTIEDLTREQKILFLKYAAKEVPEHFGFYNEKNFNSEMNTISDIELSKMVDEVNWLWK